MNTLKAACQDMIENLAGDKKFVAECNTLIENHGTEVGMTESTQQMLDNLRWYYNQQLTKHKLKP